MTVAAARLIMALAAQSLGSHRRIWAGAMAAELEAAEEDGRPLRFALGCLIGAWRTLPQHAEGRFAIASYTLALGLVLPIASMLVLAAAFGFPFADASDGYRGYLSGSGAHVSRLNEGSFTIAPSLTAAMLLLAGCHLPLAWWTLDGDWGRVGAVTRLGAATVTTLALVTSCVALDPTRLLVPVSALTLELSAVRALAWWHARLSDGDAPEDLGTEW